VIVCLLIELYNLGAKKIFETMREVS